MNNAIGVSTVFVSCHANVMSLEMISASEEGKKFGYCLTFLQFIVVSILSLPRVIFIYRWPAGKKMYVKKLPSNNKNRSYNNHSAPPLVCFPLMGNWVIGIRPIATSIKMLLLMSFIFWFTSVLNNVALSFNISVPLHTVFRSSSLIFNILLGVAVANKRYSYQQVACVVILTGGLMLLTYLQTLKKDKSQQGSSPGHSDTMANAENTTGNQYIGLLILIFTSMMAPVLAMVQESAMRPMKKDVASSDNKEGSDEEKEQGLMVSYAPMWAEAMSGSHIFAIPFFLLSSYSSFTYENFFALPSSQFHQLIVNLISQYFCVTGVFTVAAYSSAFVLTLTLTLRKAFSIIFSLIYFGHFFVLSPMEYISILLVCSAGSIYPFLKKAPSYEKSHQKHPSGKVTQLDQTDGEKDKKKID